MVFESGEFELIVPDPPINPPPASDYMFHVNTPLNLPLEMLQDSKLKFNLKVDTNQRWNWPQNLVYGMNLRIYSPVPKKLEEIRLNNKQIGSSIKLSLQNIPEEIDKVEYIGLYEDVNFQGDGIYRQWQFYYHKAQMRGIIGTSKEKPYAVNWETASVPCQEFPVSIMARVHFNDGSIYQTKAVQLGLPSRKSAVLLVKPWQVSTNWVTREKNKQESFFLDMQANAITEASLYWRSWSPCYSKGFSINGTPLDDKAGELPCYAYYEHNLVLEKLSALKYGKNTLETNLTPLVDGHMVHGMEVQYPGVMLKLTSEKNPQEVSIYQTSYEGRSHFVINTPELTWYFDIRGGGFSRIIDRSGNDWIGFKKEPWGEYPASAASAFRGIPNLVFVGDNGGAGHPGFDKCTSEISAENSIITKSTDGKWEWEWTFFESYASLNVLKTDPDTPYWFLYEGTPGGKYTPDMYYFGTNHGGPIDSLPDYYKGNSIFENNSWIYAGHTDQEACLFMVHTTPGDEAGLIGFLGNTEEGMDSPDGMTVFGFGRNRNTEPLLNGSHQFTVGIYPHSIKSAEHHIEFTNYTNEITQITSPNNEKEQ